MTSWPRFAIRHPRFILPQELLLHIGKRTVSPPPLAIIERGRWFDGKGAFAAFAHFTASPPIGSFTIWRYCPSLESLWAFDDLISLTLWDFSKTQRDRRIVFKSINIGQIDTKFGKNVSLDEILSQSVLSAALAINLIEKAELQPADFGDFTQIPSNYEFHTVVAGLGQLWQFGSK